MPKVFVLKLENDKWYVGYSSNPKRRIMHLFGKSIKDTSLWVQNNRPLEVVDIIDGDKPKQKEVTLRYMDKFGVDNVRGHAWSAAVFLPGQQASALRHIEELLVADRFRI